MHTRIHTPRFVHISATSHLAIEPVRLAQPSHPALTQTQASYQSTDLQARSLAFEGLVCLNKASELGGVPSIPHCYCPEWRRAFAILYYLRSWIPALIFFFRASFALFAFEFFNHVIAAPAHWHVSAVVPGTYVMPGCSKPVLPNVRCYRSFSDLTLPRCLLFLSS